MLICSRVLKLWAQTLAYKKVYYILGELIMKIRDRSLKSIIFILTNLKIKSHI